jgi:hypothetical protein
MDSRPNIHGRRKAIFARAEMRRFRPLGGTRMAKLHRIAAQHYDADPDRALRNSEIEVRDLYGSILSAVLLQLAIAFIKVLIERWLDSRLEQAPSRIEYDDEDQVTGDEPSEDSEFRWGATPKKVKGAYHRAPFAPAGSFGPREAGSTLATAMMLQPVMLATSYTIEQYAEQANPATSGMAVFGVSYLLQLCVTLGLKIVANLLRNFGASVARDVGAWLWFHVTTAIGVSLWDSITGWLPGRRRRRPINPDRDRDSNPSPTPDNGRRRPIIDWLFPRRRKS